MIKHCILFASIVFLTCVSSVRGQRIREIHINETEVVLENIELEYDEELQLTFSADTTTISFIYSSIIRMPTGTFSRDYLEAFAASSSGIEILKRGDFINAVSLREVHFPNNPIGILEDYVFEGASVLEMFVCSRCSLTEIEAEAFHGLDHLRYVGLFGNYLVTLPETVFSSLYSLDFLDLGNNELIDIRFANLSNLLKLDTLGLQNNNLTLIEPYKVISPALQMLLLFGNHLTRLYNYAFSELPTLFQLSMHRNEIKVIEEHAFYGLGQLNVMFMDDNLIEVLPTAVFVPLVSLFNFDISHNMISNINPGHFSNQPNLVTLSLHHNNLKEVDMRSFVAMTSLQTLLIHSNNITLLNLDRINFILPSLEFISVTENGFMCYEAANILTNLRKFQIIDVRYYDPNHDRLVLDGIGCYEYAPVP